MTESPRDPSIYRVQSTASDTRSSIYPVQSAQSSLSSFTSYFGASTLGQDDEQRHAMDHTGSDSPVPAITQAFAPYVPVVASKDANDLAKRKGFSSLFDLLRPFGENIESKVTYKDTNGQSTQLDNFNLNFIEMGPLSNLVNYGQTDSQRPGLVPPTTIYAPGGDLVALERQIENEMRLAGENMTDTPDKTDRTKENNGSSAYFDSFFASLMTAIPTSPHETFSHPVASCIIISSHNQSPIESLVSLYKSSSEYLPAYIDPGFLRYYVLIHDENEHELDKSLALFGRMKNSFGTHCYMLRLTSKTATIDNDAVLEVPTFERKSAPERLRSRWHGSRANSTFLPTAPEEDSTTTKIRYVPYADYTGIVSMVREMVTQSIVPYMERCVTLWNDQVAAPRRGLAGRFFKAGRSLWGSNSRSATPMHGNGNYDPTSSSYPPNSPEAQLRKLADFAFMLRDWKLANSVYDMLRKDFSNDKAWKHHAGAQEMFVVSQLLMASPVTSKMRAEVIEPTLDSALYGYLSRCSSPFSALRAMLLTAELLRIRPGGAKDDAAKWIMRTMESNLVGEMTRALLVERTAYCFSTGESPLPTVKEGHDQPHAVVNYRGSRLRKAAFWSVLAAEHWSTIGKHRLARHALSEALDVYGNTKWIAIQGTLNLLKTESGLVKDYQLTPPVVTPTEETKTIPSTPTAASIGTQEKMASISAVMSSESIDKTAAISTPNHDTKDDEEEIDDEDDTTTVPQESKAHPAPDIAADDIAGNNGADDAANEQDTTQAKIDDDVEEVDDPLRIE